MIARWARSTPRRRSRARRRCPPTRSGGWRKTSPPSGGGGASSRPGPRDFSWTRTHQIAHDPLPILLGAYEEHGPIFSMRLLHTQVVFMLGPEANHFVTVGHPENFHWRESSFGDLIPLLGDGLLTVDDEFHDRARAIMMPAFHREQIAAATAAMAVEAEAAIAALRPGEVVDVYAWMRNLAMRIAMRALLGLDPDEAGKGAAAAEHFERALGYYGIDYGAAPAARPRLALAQADRLAQGPRRDRLRRDRPPPRRARPRAPRHPQPPGRRPRRGRRGLHRPRGPRPGDDADVRRPRHLDLDPDLHAARAGPPPRRPRPPRRGAGPGARRRRPHPRAARARAALPRHGPRRGPAPLPAGLDRPAPRRPRVRVRRLDRPPRRLRQLQLLGQPPHPRGLPRARGLHPRALHPRAQGGAAARRLRPLRRRPADLHRQALRPDRGEAGGDDAAAAPAPRRPPRPHDDRAPDADPLAQGGSAAMRVLSRG